MTASDQSGRWRRREVLATALASTVAPAAAAAQGTEASQDQLSPGLVGEFRRGSGPRNPAILVLGGSEGGVGTAAAGARIFSELGYSALGIAYFKAPGLPDTAELIPLEYFTRAIDWLAAHPAVDRQRIAVVGGSKGAEAALLLASRDQRIAAVVACAPSSVVWAGVRPMSTSSSWTSGGAPVPFTPYDLSAPFRGIRDLYDRSYAKAPPEAVIPVERINGPLLLVSGGKDELWPASPMADAIVARLDAGRSSFQRQHLSYPDAGHAVFGPARPRVPGAPPLTDAVAATEAARHEAWPKVLQFLQESLTATG